MRTTTLSKHLNQVLAAVLTIVALAMGQVVKAESTFQVTSSYNPTTKVTTFTITRSGDTTSSGSVKYRTVSLSALAGVHFTGVSDTWNYEAGETTKEVAVTETNIKNISSPYYFQEGTTRSYRFEVTTADGSQLASKERDIPFDSSCQVTTASYNEKTIHVITTQQTITDAGYTDNYAASVNLNSSGGYYKVSAPKTFFVDTSAKLFMSISFDAHEKIDGYQYVQISANQAYDKDKDPDGKVNTPVNSLFKACMDHGAGSDYLSSDQSGIVATDYRYTFPLATVADGGGTTLTQLKDQYGYYEDIVLKQQRYKSGCRADDGRLIIPTDLTSLNILFDARGKDKDDWVVNNLDAKIQAIDNQAPVLKSSGCVVTDGPYYYGYHVAISLPFDEIVKVTDTPVLKTSWGNFSYIAGDGTNVLTFYGTITNYSPTTLSVTELSGTIKDLMGNQYSGSASFNLNLTSQGVTLDNFTKISENTYAIANKNDLKKLSSYINAGNKGKGITFEQTADITSVGSFTTIGNSTISSQTKRFAGTYDGKGFLISGISASKSEGYNGLFGYLDKQAVVKNVHLASSSFSGWRYIGAIAGYSNEATVLNCRVESSVTLTYTKINGDYYNYFGGVVGYNVGTVEGCYCATKINITSSVTTETFGGIVGYSTGNRPIKNCVFNGTSFKATKEYGAIVGKYGYIEDLINNISLTADFKTLGNLTSSGTPGASLGRRIIAGSGVSVTPTAAATVYDVSGITAYGTTAILFNDKLYSGNQQEVSFTLSHSDKAGYTFDGYTTTAGTLSGTENPYTLTMADAAATINPVWSIPEASTPQGYSTYYNGVFDFTLPAGMTASIVTAETGGKLTYETIADGDKAQNTVPSGTAVVLCNTSDTPGNLSLSETDVDSRTFDSNLLHGSDADATTTGGDKYYKLTYGSAAGHESIFGWYWGAADGAAFTSPAHKAWLALPGSASTSRFFGLPGDETTGVSLTPSLSQGEGAWYTLDGRKLIGKPMTKGVYIVNGKKRVIK